MSGSPPLLLSLYRALTRFIGPVAFLKERNKLRPYPDLFRRSDEKRGLGNVPRPLGSLLWFHAASVGESQSISALVDQLLNSDPDLSVLITTGTVTSAQVFNKQSQSRVIHQFAPLDSPKYISAFLDYWQPNMCIFVESELWPNMIMVPHTRGIPIALINARMSNNTLAIWAKHPSIASYLLKKFSLIICQSTKLQNQLIAWGGDAQTTFQAPTLKASIPPNRPKPHALDEAQRLFGTRHKWVASSTHKGEDKILLEAHKTLCQTYPDLLLILVPRHPERADQISNIAQHLGLTVARRSKGDTALGKHVYLADTMGEVMLWYTLSDITFMGGSLVGKGGHNPYEPAHAGTALLFGPNTYNFAEAYALLADQTPEAICADGSAVSAQVTKLLDAPSHLEKFQNAAQNLSSRPPQSLDFFANHIQALMPNTEP